MSEASHPGLLQADAHGIARAAEHLRNGGLVAVPTETVYGLAARADRDESVAAIYRAKGRPSFNPLIVHVADVEHARRLAMFDAQAERLAKAFWPGPLTLVLPLQPSAGLALAVTAGLATVALRCPAHPVMQGVLAAAGLPLAAPSANRSGAVSPTQVEHVVASLGSNVDVILDGGACAAGLESTIVALRQDGSWNLLRPGPIDAAQVQSVLGRATSESLLAGVESPGQLASHYAPGKPVRLNATSRRDGEFMIGFGDVMGDAQLSLTGDLAEAASRLYAVLHEAASAHQARIAVAPIPERDIGVAINDRLRRAAA